MNRNIYVYDISYEAHFWKIEVCNWIIQMSTTQPILTPLDSSLHQQKPDLKCDWHLVPAQKASAESPRRSGVNPTDVLLQNMKKCHPLQLVQFTRLK